MHYLPWDGEGAFWCTRVSLEITGQVIHFLLGQGQAVDDATIYRAAQNVAVIFPPTRLPGWELNRTQ